MNGSIEIPSLQSLEADHFLFLEHPQFGNKRYSNQTAHFYTSVVNSRHKACPEGFKTRLQFKNLVLKNYSSKAVHIHSFDTDEIPSFSSIWTKLCTSGLK